MVATDACLDGDMLCSVEACGRASAASRPRRYIDSIDRLISAARVQSSVRCEKEGRHGTGHCNRHVLDTNANHGPRVDTWPGVPGTAKLTLLFGPFSSRVGATRALRCCRVVNCASSTPPWRFGAIASRDAPPVATTTEICWNLVLVATGARLTRQDKSRPDDTSQVKAMMVECACTHTHPPYHDECRVKVPV